MSSASFISTVGSADLQVKDSVEMRQVIADSVTETSLKFYLPVTVSFLMEHSHLICILENKRKG